MRNPAAVLTALLAPRARAILPILTSICIVLTGTAMLTTTVSLHLSDPAVTTHAVQAILTAYPVGFLVGCLLVRHLVRHLGHERTYLVVTLTAGLAACGVAATASLPAWFGLRLLGGLSMSSLFIVAESWVNLYADQANRGSLFSLYMLTTVISGLIGQVILEIVGPKSPHVLAIAGGIVLLGALYKVAAGAWPALPAAHPLPAPDAVAAPAEPPYSLWRLALAAPVTVVAVFQAGMTNLNIFVMTPIYGSQLGLSAAATVGLVTAVSIGGAVAQTPVGWLSDRFDRCHILLGQGLVGLSLCAAIAAAGRGPTWLLDLLFFGYGATALTIYPVALAFANSRIHSHHMVAASGALLMVYSLGNVLTPGVAAGLMQRIAPQALFFMLGTGAVLVAGTAWYNLARRGTSRTLGSGTTLPKAGE